MTHGTDQKGFMGIEVLLIAVIVVLAGFTGWFVYHSNRQANATLDAASKESKRAAATGPAAAPGGGTLSLDGDKVTITLPKNWVHVPGAGVCHTDNDINCLDSVEAAPKDAAKAQVGDAFGVSIAVLPQNGDKAAQNWFFDDYLHAIQTDQYKVTPEAVNGSTGLMVLDNGGSYQDVYHILLQDGLAVVTTARISDSSYEPGTMKIAGVTSYSQYVPDISAIARSVRFK